MNNDNLTITKIDEDDLSKSTRGIIINDNSHHPLIAQLEERILQAENEKQELLELLTPKINKGMKRKNVNLTTSQCKELDEVITSLVSKYKTEYIFCFSCLNDAKTTTSCFAGDVKVSDTHYFLLMITTDITRIEHEVQDYVNGFFEKGTITIVVHGLETVTNAIEQGSRFFTAVCRDGMQLYSASGLRLNVEYPDLNPATTFTKAQKHFYHRFGMAWGFQESASTSHDNGMYNNCMFELHQSVEQACIAVIRVYMAYRSDMHNLARLLNLCKCFSDGQIDLFPRRTEEDKRLFQILVRSYSDARYKDEYQVFDHDAEELCTRVQEFCELIKKLCKEKLTEYRQEAEEAGKEIEEYLPIYPEYLFA
ncbi:MAG TPA: HEPN domain-containing protein [Mucilaginibacter sp.]|jgi:HEPN domain-containing protein|nr:HEPN domain-containing protein [Mucilaginibacter sp.]